jgi:hypothetical protein
VALSIGHDTPLGNGRIDEEIIEPIGLDGIELLGGIVEQNGRGRNISKSMGDVRADLESSKEMVVGIQKNFETLVASDIFEDNFEHARHDAESFVGVLVVVVATNLSGGIERDEVDLAEMVGHFVQVGSAKEFDQVAPAVRMLLALIEFVKHKSSPHSHGQQNTSAGMQPPE